MFFFSLYCCQMALLVHHLPFTAHLAFLDWGSASAVLAGLAHTPQRANSSERGALLHWREGSTVPPVLAVIPELWPARSAGNEEALDLLHTDMFRPEQQESSRAFHRGCQPTSVLWENPWVWAAECSDSCKKCVSCDQGISFILNRCIVMSKTLSQNFPRIGTQGFQIVPSEVHARCLSPCPQLPACRVTRWAPTCPGQVFRNWHNSNDSIRPKVSPVVWSVWPLPGKVAWSSLIFLVWEWTVLCYFPCTERCCEIT